MHIAMMHMGRCGEMIRTIAKLVIAAALLTACGPSAKEVQHARHAVYTCPAKQVFQAMIDAMKDRHLLIARVDTSKAMIVSDYRWHSKDGVPKDKGAAVVGPGDLEFAIVAALKDDGGDYQVFAQPSVLSHVTGSPRGKQLDRTDADWPGWADSKIDVYMVDVYQPLKSCTSPPASQ